MSRFWIAAAAAFVSASAANAQTHWGGLYGGVNAFGARDKTDTSGTLFINQISNLFVTGRGIVVVPGTTRDFAASGHKTDFDWGGQIGFQFQTGPVVLGIEGDYDGAHHDIAATQSQTLPPTALTPSATIDSERDVHVNRLWSIRARAGYAFGRTLLYATGGYASARVSVFGSDAFTNPGGAAAPCTPNCTANLGPEGPNTTFSSNARKTSGGWRAGLGIDQRLTRHFSIGLEYLHTDFGGRDVDFHSSVTTFAGPFTHGTDGGSGTHGQINAASTRVALTSDAIGARLNFRF